MAVTCQLRRRRGLRRRRDHSRPRLHAHSHPKRRPSSAGIPRARRRKGRRGEKDGDGDDDSIAATLRLFAEMPQPSLRRAPDLTPPPREIVYTDVMTRRAAAPDEEQTGYAVVLSWLVWLADILFMLNLIPGDPFRNIFKDPLVF